MSAQRRDPRLPTPLTDHHLYDAKLARLRDQLAGSERARALLVSDLDAAYAELRTERLARRRLEGLTRRPTRRTQALGLAHDAAALLGLVGVIIPVLAFERTERRVRALWRSMTDPATKHDSWTLPIACGVSVAVFLLAVLASGQ